MTCEKISAVLNELEKQASFQLKNNEKIPHNERMLAITKDIGLFYNILLRSIKASNILEIGTSYGYSTLWFIEAILENKRKKGRIITIEKEKKKIKIAKKNFSASKVSECIDIRQGEAIDILSDLSKEVLVSKKLQKFDFIFIDADKENYIKYFDASLPLLKKGGIIGADNIILPKRFNKLMKEYVNHVRKNPKVRSVTIPIDNGEEISLKL